MRFGSHDVVELAQVAQVVGERPRVERRERSLAIRQRSNGLVELLPHPQLRTVFGHLSVLIEQDAVAGRSVSVGSLGVSRLEAVVPGLSLHLYFCSLNYIRVEISRTARTGAGGLPMLGWRRYPIAGLSFRSRLGSR